LIHFAAFGRHFFVCRKAIDNVKSRRHTPYMAITPEKKVKNKVVALLKERGAYYFFPATYGMGRSGVPDIVACYRGRFIGIECKAGKNTPTELQKRELAAIARLLEVVP
jgi:Holliday junction resolvase